MDDTQFKEYLLQRYINNQATDEELEIFFHLIEKDQLDDTVKKYMEIEADKASAEPQPKKNNLPVRALWKWSVAASVVLIASAGIYFAQNSGAFNDEPSAAKNNQQHDIAPGGNKAILTLSDGSKIILDEAKTGTLANQGNTAILKSRDGQLIYDASQSADNKLADVNYNTISTPRGGQYQVILPDGSKVWLNAASSIRFPAVFTGNERSVAITGEAYFEVAKNKAMPFKVTVNEMEVAVLGTHFNIMAYQEEGTTNTTLLEGSVRVTKGKASETLVPGQQARVGTGIRIFPADVKEAVAWKDGYFIFKNENIFSIMRKISRWYNVDIEYKGDVSTMIFGGIISRDRNVSEVFKILELTNAVHFKIEGRRIIVMP